ncbi:hypothetical protein AB1Y20_020442 [Prymnesium parvum]|uniref:TLC domain-containing protein n=1 Tax=Prymnesium parvum TaxID=97485 RepID=A0AB34JTF9_PRYPA
MWCDCALGRVDCWRLVALGGLAGVAWAALQALLNLTLFHAAAKLALGGGAARGDCVKLVQQLSELSTYAVMFGVGLVLVPHTPCFSDATACWEEVRPVTTLRPELLLVYLVQLGGYCQMLLSERVLRWTLGGTEPLKLDVIVHHAITLILLGGSLGSGPYTPIGALVTLTHDTSTIFLKLARVLQLSGATRMAVPAFGLFALSFFAARLVGFAYLALYRSYVYVRSHGPFGFSTNPLHAAQSLLVVLVVLYLLDCFWFLKIVQTILNRPKQKGH